MHKVENNKKIKLLTSGISRNKVQRATLEGIRGTLF